METLEAIQSVEAPPREVNDEVLITLFQGGDEYVFRQLVERYQNRIRDLVHSIFRNDEFVDDIAQDVFIKAYEGLKKFKFNSSFYTWLYRIAVNTCRDEMRKRKNRRFISFESLSESMQQFVHNKNAIQPSDGELKEVLADYLAKLPEKYRIPIVLKDVQGLSYEEIADVMDCEMGTVKSRLSRARSMMRDQLRPYLEGQL
jgi:RNA polymerase sigma-70 factor, ECF subfamily